MSTMARELLEHLGKLLALAVTYIYLTLPFYMQPFRWPRMDRIPIE
jgi:hypothetical protein